MELQVKLIIILTLFSAYSDGFVLNLDNTTTEGIQDSNLIRIKRQDAYQNVVVLPVYLVCLIAVTLFIMLVAIVGLIVVLYLIIKNKQIFGINVGQVKHVQQKPAVELKIYNDENFECDDNKSLGSTLTVNCNNKEVNQFNVPVTPTSAGDTKIIFPKTAFKSAVPIPRVQMDQICKEVLRKVQKSDSASYRDLNELLKVKSDDQSESNIELLKRIENLKKHDNKNNYEPTYDLVAETTFYTNTDEINANIPNLDLTAELSTKLGATGNYTSDTKYNTQTKRTNEIQLDSEASKIKSASKYDIRNDAKVKYDNKKDIDIDSDSETEYDTVPNPIRYRQDEFDDYVENIPVYDLPPGKCDEEPKTLVVLDNASQYLLPVTADHKDYINAKRISHHSIQL